MGDQRTRVVTVTRRRISKCDEIKEHAVSSAKDMDKFAMAVVRATPDGRRPGTTRPRGRRVMPMPSSQVRLLTCSCTADTTHFLSLSLLLLAFSFISSSPLPTCNAIMLNKRQSEISSGSETGESFCGTFPFHSAPSQICLWAPLGVNCISHTSQLEAVLPRAGPKCV